MDIIGGIGFGILVLVGLSIVVFLHEGGHFLAARWAGVEVEAFAIGWGKVLWSWKPGNTEYRICLLPLGGYCKMKGEQDLIAAMGKADGRVQASEGSLFSVPAWKRIVISAAGPVANLLTALLVYMAISLVGTPAIGPESRILLASEVDGRTGTAAEAAGLQTGDRVLAVGERPLRSFADLQAAIAASRGQEMHWTIDRNGQKLDKTVQPRIDAQTGGPLVGVYSLNPPLISKVTPGTAAALAGFLPGDKIVAIDGSPTVGDQIVYYRLTRDNRPSHDVEVERSGALVKLTYVTEGPQSPMGLDFVVPRYEAQGQGLFEAAVTGTDKTFHLLGQMIQGLGRLFAGKENPVQALSGPVGIVGQGTQAMAFAFGEGLDFGLSAFINLLAFLSLALFLMNLLPIPALDGGSIVVSLIEMVRRKRLGIKALMAYQQAGVVIVLGLLLFTTLNDFGLFGKV